jgi:hypothetical protein
VTLDVPLTDMRDVKHVHRLLLHMLLDLIDERVAAVDRRRSDRQSLSSVLDWPKKTTDSAGTRRRHLINLTGKAIPP